MLWVTVGILALIATHGGLSLEWCAVVCHISPMALYRLACALGQHKNAFRFSYPSDLQRSCCWTAVVYAEIYSAWRMSLRICCVAARAAAP
jgi:hypothetical protein